MSGTLLPLFKVTLKQTFDFRGKNKKNVSFWLPVLLILILGSIFSAFYTISFAEILKNGDVDYRYILYAMSGLASLLCITTTITKIKPMLFAGNDYDLLASMPIPKYSIILVKFVSIYLMELLYSFILTIPPMVVILIYGCTPLCVLEAILLMLLLPLLPLLVASIIGVVIGFISDRYRFGNVLTMIFYLLFMVGVIYLSMTMSSSTDNPADILKPLQIFMWYNPSLYLFTSLPTGVNYLAFVGISLISLMILVLVMAFCYDYFHILLTTTKSHRKYVAKQQRQKGQFKALFSLDIKRYFTSKSYLMNTITGGLLTIVMTIVLLVTFLSFDDPEVTDVLKMIAPYFVLFVMWCVGVAVPSSVAINFEGKYFWQIKSLPISYKQYSYSKILLSEIVLAPFVLVASIILIVFSEKNFINIITLLLLPQLYLVSMNFIGYYINMYFYKLNWTNEMEAVKNSKGMIIAMLIDFAYTIAIIGTMLGLGIPFGFLFGAIASFVLVISMMVVFIVLVNNNCVRQINTIEL